jgi:dienelactone hydrolase
MKRITYCILLLSVLCTPSVSAQDITPEQVWQEPWEGVPDHYTHWDYPDFNFPDALEDWSIQRKSVRATLMRLLGDVPARPEDLDVRTLSREERDGYVVEKFVFDNGFDSEVPGYLILPVELEGPAPAVLVMHGHGSSKENILGTEPSSQTVGPMLARNGYVVLAIDNYFNGERRGKGPAGEKEMQDRGPNQEGSLFKLNLWFGRSLWGMMLRDEQIALDYLTSRPEVDPRRIGASGMSMGSTRSWWLASIDDRIKALVGIACFTRYKELIEQRRLSAHGIYYFVPGMLQHFDSEAVMGLIAPRPFLALTGDSDSGSPLSGIYVLEEKLREVYGLYDQPDHFESIIYENTGHVYTDEMKARMLEWFDRYLR